MGRFKPKIVDPSLYPREIRISAAADAEPFKLEAAAEGEAPSLKKFSMTAYTGGSMRVGMGYPVVVDLAGMKVAAQSLPILKDHDPGNIAGHSTAIEISAQRIKVSGVMSGVGAGAQEVMALAANEFPWQASIGASIESMERVDQGQSVKVNGKSFTGPLWVARKSTLGEVSFVAMGADSATSARVAASKYGVSDMKFEQWLEAKGVDISTISDALKATLQAAFDAEQSAKPPADKDAGITDITEQVKAAVSAERKRVAGIEIACKGEWGNQAASVETMKARAINGEITMEQLQTELLGALRAARPTGPAIHSHDPDKADAGAIEASLLLASGIKHDLVAKQFDDKTMTAATSKDYRRMTISGVMHETMRAAGVYHRPGAIDGEFIASAVKANGMLKASGFSTISLPGILGNTANKAMIASYDAQEVIWPYFCAVRNHNDFKVHTRYRLDSTGAFKKVGADGELKHVGLAQGSYTNQLATFGAMIALTRQMIINDDLGAFMEIPNMLGRMAAVRQEEAAFVLLLSNPSSFFASGNRNYMSGGTSPLAISSLATAEQKFRDQVDSNAKPILVSPQVLLTGTSLKVTADDLYSVSTIVATTTTDKPLMSNNPHKGKYRPYASPYINNTAIKDQDNAAITGQSSTAWFLFADPSVRAAIAMALLNGQRQPTLESAETDFNTLGMQWRSFSDFGVGMEDPYAAVMSAGA